MAFKWNKAELGTCYYPEHWDESLWADDLDRMFENGIKTVRIAEFAWNKIEPQEGVFTFEFFDDFLSLAAKKGMKVIMGTPTATPPAWLTNKYPEVLNVRIDGVPLHHGARRHYNYNSPVYRKFCARIVEKMAENYAAYNCVIGWQIDNELNCEVNEFYSESDTVAFRVFLKKKFGTLDNLNKALGMTFWNQTYTSWDEIFVPRTTINNTVNPHLKLEYKRFISHSAISFAKLQADVLRKYIKEGDFITTNGMFGNLDNHKLSFEVLDTYCYDSYPNFAYMAGPHPNDLKDRQWSRYLSEVRSIRPHFGIMEQQSGANGWNCGMEAPAPKPGQIALWTMQSVAHGADYISYFRWRTSCMGTEIYWHGILDYDNRNNRKLVEIRQIGERLEKMSDVVNCDYKSEFAVVRDYDNVFDSEVDVWHGRIEGESMKGIFAASQKLHTSFDYLYINDESSIEDALKYKALIYTHPAIMTESRAKLLSEYVKMGGTLVLGCRVGYKDIYGKCPVNRLLPGYLRALTGVDVLEYTFINGDDGVRAELGGQKIEANTFRDIIKAEDCKILASYDGDFYKGTPALTERFFGEGRVLYYASTFSEDAAAAILKYLKLDEPYSNFVSASEEIELQVRGKYLFALNYSAKEQKLVLNKPLKDIDCGDILSGELTLNPYQTSVFLIEW